MWHISISTITPHCFLLNVSQQSAQAQKQLNNLSQRVTNQARQWPLRAIGAFFVGSQRPPAPPACRPLTTIQTTSSSGRSRECCWASVPSYLPSLAPLPMPSCLLDCYLHQGECWLRHPFCLCCKDGVRNAKTPQRSPEPTRTPMHLLLRTSHNFPKSPKILQAPLEFVRHTHNAGVWDNAHICRTHRVPNLQPLFSFSFFSFSV